jgi:hypothetical protein
MSTRVAAWLLTVSPLVLSAFVIGLWWSGVVQKTLQFLGNFTPPGAP